MGSYGFKQSQKELVVAYGAYVAEQIHRGWDGYLLTFMYTQLRGSSSTVLEQMFGEVERVYATLLTRMVRNPHSAAARGRLPRLLACPDFPVFKHVKVSLTDVVINDGQHLHGILLVRPRSRLGESLDGHFAGYERLYLGRAGRLRRIHVQRITRDPAYVTGYALKALQVGRVSLDDVLILPRTSGELRDRPAA